MIETSTEKYLTNCPSQITVIQATNSMSDSKLETEEVVRRLEEGLNKMPGNLRSFSMAMRSLYSDKNPGTFSDVSNEFSELRDKIRENAKVYLKAILPFTTTFVCAIKDFFEYYDAMLFEEWRDSWPDILEDVKNNKDLADTLLKMYNDIIDSLKKREEDANIITTKFKEHQTEYENEIKELQAKVKTHRKRANFWGSIPVVKSFLTPSLESDANENSAKAIAMTQELKIHKAAAVIVTETLIPALDEFIKSLKKAANFFEVMHKKMNSFDEESKKSHYKITKKYIQKINASCHEFNTALPVVRTDFEAIPDGDTQKNYVEEWLEKKLEEIREKRESTQKSFVGAIKEKLPCVSKSDETMSDAEA